MKVNNDRSYFEADVEVEDTADLDDKFITIRVLLSDVAATVAACAVRMQRLPVEAAK